MFAKQHGYSNTLFRIIGGHCKLATVSDPGTNWRWRWRRPDGTSLCIAASGRVLSCRARSLFLPSLFLSPGDGAFTKALFSSKKFRISLLYHFRLFVANIIQS